MKEIVTKGEVKHLWNPLGRQEERSNFLLHRDTGGRMRCVWCVISLSLIDVNSSATSFISQEFDSFEELCIFCDPFSLQQYGAIYQAVSLLQHANLHGHFKFLRYNKHQCFSCCSQLNSMLTQMLDKPSTYYEDNNAILWSLWYINVRKILSNPPTFNNSVINVSTCCEFSYRQLPSISFWR